MQAIQNIDDFSKEDRNYAKRCVQIDVNDLQGEFIRVSSDLYHWRGRLVDAIDEESRASGARKLVSAEHYQRLWVLKDGGKKNLTETAIDAAIQASGEYQEALEKEREASRVRGEIAAVVEAINAKRELLVSLGAHVRHEQDIRIRESDKTRY